jgi:hypothetical protein
VLGELFSGIADVATAIAPGLGDLVPEASAELGRLGMQGAAELAGALFNGQAYTPYGEGQRPVGHEGIDNSGIDAPQIESGGMEM